MSGPDIAGLPGLIRDPVDEDPCWLDHHGACQAHGYLTWEPSELCPHAEAKALLVAHGVGVDR